MDFGIELKCVVDSDDADGILRYREHVGLVKETLYEDLLQDQLDRIKRFQEGEEFQGPLDPLLEPLGDFPDVIGSVRAFEKAACGFKDGQVQTLTDMLTGHGHWDETKVQDTARYRSERDRYMEDIRRLYKAAMAELTRVVHRMTVPVPRGVAK